MKMKIDAKGIKAITKKLEKDAKAAEKVLKATTSDMKRRVPGKVADDVRTRYNIKKAEIAPSKTKSGKKPPRKAGTIRVTGDSVSSLEFEYKGRLLTPVRFGMTPKAPPPFKNLPEKGPGARKHRKLEGSARAALKKRRRTIRAQIIKGQKKAVHKKAFLLPTGADKDNPDKVPFIPVIRKGPRRSKTKAAQVEAIKTTSLAQMIENKKINAKIREDINKMLRDRLNNHMKRFMKK